MVDRGDVDARDGGQRRREQAPLEPLTRLDALLVQQRTVERLGRLRCQRSDETALVVVEQPLLVEAEPQRAEPPAVHGEGHRAERHRRPLQRDQLREPLVAILAGLDPDRFPGAQRNSGRQLGVLRLAAEQLDDGIVVPDRARHQQLIARLRRFNRRRRCAPVASGRSPARPATGERR